MGITNDSLNAIRSASTATFNQGINQDLLAGLEGADRTRMEAQLKLQQQQETVAFVSNTLKKLNEIAMSVINNMR
ncbi:hypothetical protein [Vitiosangium sp. GDMCC 1.1324]|uniref:hypothetical protein n=1 Tax=Vitiosangium sp. (strain GDMCC 1.1324) TaxID=2138576 RepID=UPI000D382056|nr:hypothetical protein [Vitiosangium sp. GDMCC 1.1324]PTL78691.1 hypothetical protein DAT35_37100 [Vitiosangium sp. GDMCC 1.1324]PTL81491.1 hypothetical protein DAT35_21225 [Vitiosangium sp. GDMCC 1.1324]